MRILKEKIRWGYIISTFFIIFVLHNAQNIIAQFFSSDSQSQFTPFAYKAPFSLSEDNLSYASIIRYSGNHFSLYRPDPLIKENKGLHFADGNLANIYVGLFHKITNNINITYYFSGFLPLLLSVILIFKIIQIFFQQHAIPITVCLSIILLCSNFDDFLGLTKFLNGYFFMQNYHSNYLVLGYSQRFVFCQVSIVLLLFWIYALIKYLATPTIQKQILVACALVLLQYTYFYYWSFAVPITAALIFFTKKRWKEYSLILLLYFALTAHFWFTFYQFNQLEFADEYLNRIKGEQMYPLLWIIISGTIIILPSLKKGKVWLNILLIVSPMLATKVINYITFHLHSSHFLFQAAQISIPLSLIVLVIVVIKANRLQKWAALGIVNYYGIYLFCQLKFIIGYNVQPYHWVYASYYPLFIFSLLLNYRGFFKSKIGQKTLVFAAILVVVFSFLNSYKSAQRNHNFQTIRDDEQELIEFLEQYPYAVISGNNIMLNITMTAFNDLYLYRGSTSHKRSAYSESYQRYIHPFKLMGYNNDQIVEEYKKYEQLKEYHTLFISDNEQQRDSLAQVYPDNTLGAAEALHCYFLDASNYLQDFKEALKNYTKPQYELNFLVIYKPTFRGDLKAIKGQKVLENETIICYQLNDKGL